MTARVVAAPMHPHRAEIAAGRVTAERAENLTRGYRVYLDGAFIGLVHAHRETSSRVYKGSRIRYDLGHPLVWRADYRAGENFTYSRRIDAIIALLERHAREEQPV